jgi:hypothetical protein
MTEAKLVRGKPNTEVKAGRRTRRKDQDIIDLAERIKKELGDNRPKSFGLYVKLVKEFGRNRIEDAFWRAVRSDAHDKIRYFLGILKHMRERQRTLRAYHALRHRLITHMTPNPQWYEPSSRNRYRKKRTNPPRKGSVGGARR